MDPYRTQAALHKALAHPVRLRILDILARDEACVCHLTAALRKPQPYVSQQLSLLREAGLVADRREGALIYYRLADEHLARLLEQGKALLLATHKGLTLPVIPAYPLKNCPCPRCQSMLLRLPDVPQPQPAGREPSCKQRGQA